MFQAIPWILTIVLYSPLIVTLYRGVWHMRDYTHAYLILPISLLMAWSQRKKIKGLFDYENHAKTYLLSLCILVFGLLLFIVGWRKEYLFIQTFSIIPVLLGLTGFLYNLQITRLLKFPILYLLLLIPLPFGILDSVTLPMRYLASFSSAKILAILGYPITRQGLLLTMGNHEIFMGAPCSGFRSLITMISLGLVYIYFIRGNFLKNLILFFSIIPLALLGNLIRILALCLITYYFGEEVGQGFFHNFSGMLIFLITILGLIGLEKLVACSLYRAKRT